MSQLHEPEYLEADSPPYGELRFVGPPPLVVAGTPLTYREPPVRYGTSTLAWRQESGKPPLVSSNA